jgi:hypothetical protein
MCNVNTDLFDFAFCGSDFNTQKLTYLKTLAQPEKWEFNNSYPNNILVSYIKHTFRKLANDRNNAEPCQKNKFIYIDDRNACFNTGLVTPKYQNIYAFFEKNRFSVGNSKEWYLKGFEVESSLNLETITLLPDRAKFFSSMDEIIYNTGSDLRVNIMHILEDNENVQRIPEGIRNSPYLVTLFEGALKLSKKIIDLNYKAAVPQYFNGRIQFLLPINLMDPEKTDLALAVEYINGFYSGRTCLTLDMAYNNARLIAKPTDWLTI